MTMTENEAKRNVVELLAEASGAVGAIGKGRTMTEGQGYKYRGQADILAKVQPAFAERGIVVVPTVIDRTVSDVERGKTNKSIWSHVVLRVRWRFYGPQMDFVDCETIGEGLDSGDKGTNKAMTASHKYALISVLQLAEAGADPDEHTAPEREYTERPAGPKPITVEQWDQIKAQSAQLDAAGKAEIKSWAEGNGLTVTNVTLSHGQAVAVLAKLDQLLAATQPSEAPPSPTQDGPCEQCGHVGPLVAWTPEETGVAQLVCADEPACLARLEERQGASA